MSTPIIERYVDEVLNRHSSEALHALFAANFKDNHPLRIPGVLEPPPGPSSIDHVEKQVEILGSPGTDIAFTLEDWFEGGDNRTAYRLFGEGTVPLVGGDLTGPEEARDLNQEPIPRVKKLAIPGSRLQFTGVMPGDPRMVGDRLHVRYRTVGIFRTAQGQFIERWGEILVD